jgi:hypothetical protein
MRMIPMDIKKIALSWISSNIDTKNWPEDDWATLTEDYDISIYIDGDDAKRATVFPVMNGETNIELPIEII